MSTQNLINAIITGDAIEIENAFGATMGEKIASSLNDKRIELAQNLFTGSQVEEATEE